MQVAIHLGAHCTDNGRLLKTLLQNKGLLAREGIAVPGPGRYRKTLLRAAQKLRDKPACADSREILIESIVDDDSARRMVLSFEDFICPLARMFENGRLYARAAHGPAWLANVFAGCEVEFFLAIRNPATLVPAAFNHPDQRQRDLAAFMDGADPAKILWSEVVEAIRSATPQARLTIWCNEDTPLIWPDVIRAVSGHEAQTRPTGGLDLLAEIMKEEGLRRARHYMDRNPPRSELHRRRILAAFLDKYAIHEALEEELDAPGWCAETVERLSRIYEADLERIAAMPGIDLVAV